MLGGKSASSKRPISTTNLMRPPSRHKTPNKALGLDTEHDSEDANSNKSSRKRPNTSKMSIHLKNENVLSKTDYNTNKIVIKSKQMIEDEKKAIEAEIES